MGEKKRLIVFAASSSSLMAPGSVFVYCKTFHGVRKNAPTMPKRKKKLWIPKCNVCFQLDYTFLWFFLSLSLFTSTTKASNSISWIKIDDDVLSVCFNVKKLLRFEDVTKRQDDLKVALCLPLDLDALLRVFFAILLYVFAWMKCVLFFHYAVQLTLCTSGCGW